MNAAIPTSGAISVGDFYGATNIVNLDFTLQGGQVSRTNGTYTGVSIGTANASRMVIIQGGLLYTSGYIPPTSITLNGNAMTLLSNSGVFTAYLKVPTGTTATIVISGASAVNFETQIITLNTVNTAPNQISIQSKAIPSGFANSANMTTNPVATDGVFIWAGVYTGSGPAAPFASVTSSNPSGATVTLSFTSSVAGSGGLTSFGAYSTCSTADSRFARYILSSSGKGGATLYGAFAYFEAN